MKPIRNFKPTNLRKFKITRQKIVYLFVIWFSINISGFILEDQALPIFTNEIKDGINTDVVTSEPITTTGTDAENFDNQTQAYVEKDDSNVRDLNQITIENFIPISELTFLISSIVIMLFVYALMSKPIPIDELYEKIELDEKFNPKRKDEKIICNLSFGEIEFTWGKRKGAPNNWEIDLNFKGNSSDINAVNTFSQLLILKTVNKEDLVYKKSFKANKWPHVEYLLNYWIKDL